MLFVVVCHCCCGLFVVVEVLLVLFVVVLGAMLRDNLVVKALGEVFERRGM